MTRNHDTEAAECRERPILFSSEMVRAILDDRKSQTRRVVKLQPRQNDDGSFTQWRGRKGRTNVEVKRIYQSTGELIDQETRQVPLSEWLAESCPYGRVGDRLWVREKWKFCDWTEDGYPWIECAADGAKRLIDAPCIPDEWGERLSDIWADLSSGKEGEPAADKKWRPSIHMPRWASRITLEITDVRVERLNEITEEDAKAEGVKPYHCPQADALVDAVGGGIKPLPYTSGFANLWDSINGKSHPWSSNPYVWVVEFRRLQNILLSDGALKS